MDNSWELHPDRMATTDEEGRRVFVYPSDVKGRFRRLRTQVYIVLLIVFLVLPWIHFNGKQWLLLDVAHRKFEIFGLSLRAHDAPGLFFVLATAGFGLFFATAVWGRVWCGWACPQTVFIDLVYRRIERWIEGPALERKKLAAAPWTTRKVWLRTLKWSAYIGVSLILTHSFLAYFVGSKPLIAMVTSSPTENWTSFLFIAITTGIILFDFAWFREQFCIIMCPYGRFQSVLMDDNSQVVGYDVARGEPRRTKELKKLAEQNFGDCVNCYRCVQVCPTGIDIRRGTQLECIACTACIDACDDVMTKIKKPKGLIRYTSERELKGKQRRPLRARTFVYGGLLSLSLAGLLTFIVTREVLSVAWLKAKGAPYETVRAGGEDSIVNRFQLELSNQSDAPIFISVRSASAEFRGQIVTAINPIRIEPGQLTRADVFVRAPKSEFKNGTARTNVELSADAIGFKETKELMLAGPF